MRRPSSAIEPLEQPRRRRGRPARLEEHHQPRARVRRAGRRHARRSRACCSPTTPRRWSSSLLGASASPCEPDWAPTTVAGRRHAADASPTAPRHARRPHVGHDGPVPRPAARPRPRRLRLTGHPQLLARPMAPAFAALRALGVEVDRGRRARAPAGHDRRRRRRSTAVRSSSPGDVSSQFLSGLLLAGPAMRRRPHGRHHHRAGVAPVRRHDPRGDGGRSASPWCASEAGSEFVVAPGRLPAGDATGSSPTPSAASYFFAAAAILGGRVRVARARAAARSGRPRLRRRARPHGLRRRRSADGCTEVRGPGELGASPSTSRDLSDTAPTLAVVAAFARRPDHGHRHRVHPRTRSPTASPPSSRELRRCGVDAEEEPDGFIDHARRPAALPAPHRDLRRPPHGDELRRPRPAGAGHRDRSTRTAWPRPSRLLRGARPASE